MSTGGLTLGPAFDAAARAFLDDPRVYGPLTPAMLAAVKAWAYQESGPTIRRNNPWNLHSSGGLVGQTGADYVSPADPDVAVFDTLGHGVAAAVGNLVRAWAPAEAVLYGYDHVLAAAREGDAPAFLAALARSAWSAGRYGTKGGGANVLLPIWRQLGGTQTLAMANTLPAAPNAAHATALIAAQKNLIYADRVSDAADAYLAKAFAQIKEGEDALWAKVAAAQAAAQGEPASPASFDLHPVPDVGWPINPVAPVLPELVAAFVRNNPQIEPTTAAQIAQDLGEAGFSAQALAGLVGCTLSTAVPGLVLTAGGLPLYETQSVPTGTVLADAGLGPGGMGVYVQGPYAASPQNGHTSAAMAEMQTPAGPVTTTWIIPGTDGVKPQTVGQPINL